MASTNEYGMQLHEWSEKIGEIAISNYAPDHELSGPMGTVSKRWDAQKDQSKFLGNIQDIEVNSIGSLNGSDVFKMYFLSFNRPIGYFVLNPYYNGDYTVGSVWIDPAFRGKGIIKSAYEYVLNQNIGIVSDTSHTVDSQKLWFSFYPKYKVELLGYHGKSKEIESKEEMLQAYKDSGNSSYDRLRVSKK